MSDHGGPQLASLTDEEIANLIRVVPGLAASWARLVSSDIASLEVAKPSSLASLRAVMTRQNDQFAASVARTGFRTVLVAPDSAEFASDVGEGPVELAVAAGRVLVPSRRACFFAHSRQEAIRWLKRSPGAWPNCGMSRPETLRPAIRATVMLTVIQR